MVSHALDDQTKSLGRVLRFDDILLEIYGASAHDRRPKRSSFLRTRDASQVRLGWLYVNTPFFFHGGILGSTSRGGR